MGEQVKGERVKVKMKKSLIWIAMAAASCGCGKSVDVEGKGMYANANTGVVGIGTFEVVTFPEGTEGARIRYDEDTAWLSPSTKTHHFKVDLQGSNCTESVGCIVSNICAAFVATAPSIAAINSGKAAGEATASTNDTEDKSEK